MLNYLMNPCFRPEFMAHFSWMGDWSIIVLGLLKMFLILLGTFLVAFMIMGSIAVIVVGALVVRRLITQVSWQTVRLVRLHSRGGSRGYGLWRPVCRVPDRDTGWLFGTGVKRTVWLPGVASALMILLIRITLFR